MTKEYLSFEESKSVAKNRISKVFNVTSRTNGSHLGRVYFRPQWRKYVFEPASNTLYDAVCLSQIAGFCDGQTDAWRSEILDRKIKQQTAEVPR